MSANLDDILDKKLEEYHNFFGDAFPMEEVCLTKQETINAIDNCINESRSAKEYFKISYDKNIVY